MGETELDRAVQRLAAEIAPALVEEARNDAAAAVRATLSRKLGAALQAQCELELARDGGDAPSSRPPAPPRATAPAAETTPSTHPLAEGVREAAEGVYVYGVVSAGSELPAGLEGVERGDRVRLVERRDLAAIVSSVPLAEFDEEPLRRHLNDVAWLEEKARRHEDVLEAVLGATAVVPLRLCTVFSGEPEVGEMLEREREVLLDALSRLAGKAEWGVKVFAGDGALEREVAARAEQAQDEAMDVSAGIAYMNRRRREARARSEVEEVADEWSHRIHELLAAGAAEALLNPLQRPEVSGRGEEMLLNGVYLVADEDAEGFRALAARLTEEYAGVGVDVELTGPWPGYNFVKSSIEAAR